MNLQVLLGALWLGVGPAFAQSLTATPAPGGRSRLELESVSAPFRDRFSGQYSLGVGTSGFEEMIDDSFYSGFSFRSQAQYKLTEAVRLQGDFNFRARQGRIQSRFEQFNQDVFIQVREASVVIEPWSFLSLQAGIHNQGYLRSDLLLDDIGFPGAKETLSFQTGRLKSSLILQQAVPASRSFNTDRAESEPMPVFQSQTLEVSGRPSDSWELTGYATHYSFSSLPSVVAFESGRYGNQVRGDVAPNSRFRFEFDGALAGLESRVDVRPEFSVLLGAQVIENFAATTGSRGQIAYAQTDVEIARGVVISPRFEMFFNEANTGPAIYSDGDYGRNNRQGQMYRLDLTFRNLGFKVYGMYTNADVIDASPFQGRLQAFRIQVETLYAEF